MKSLEGLWFSFEARVRKNRLMYKLVTALATPPEFAIASLLYVARMRILQLNGPGRIGHLVTDVATFVKGRMLGLARQYTGILISPPGAAANECLLDYWQRYITVIRSPFWARLLTRLTRFRFLVHDTGTLALDETAAYIAIEREWGRRAPLLELTDAHRRRGQAWLAQLGIPAEAQFVCLHSRESGYSAYSPQDEAQHAFRNSSIENYLPAAAALTARGFWCLRMGDPTMQAIPPMDRVIDYARHPSRSDWLDVFLSASCLFFVGSCSGLVNLANVFGRPCAVANQAPLSHVYGFGIDDLCIPKLLWSEREQRMMTFTEVLRSDVANFRYTRLFEQRGIRVLENSAEDVRALALEMLERAQGRAQYTHEDEQLQQRFSVLMRPGHYSYGGVNRVGREFLRKYEHLLD
jgi:putative glycosyltransferase (TIGR04372 family)